MSAPPVPLLRGAPHPPSAPTADGGRQRERSCPNPTRFPGSHLAFSPRCLGLKKAGLLRKVNYLNLLRRAARLNPACPKKISFLCCFFPFLFFFFFSFSAFAPKLNLAASISKSQLGSSFQNAKASILFDFIFFFPSHPHPPPPSPDAGSTRVLEALPSPAPPARLGKLLLGGFESIFAPAAPSQTPGEGCSRLDPRRGGGVTWERYTLIRPQL